MKADLTNVFNSYGVRGTKEVDLGQLAGQHLDVTVGARSLQALTASLLRRRLPKGELLKTFVRSAFTETPAWVAAGEIETQANQGGEQK